MIFPKHIFATNRAAIASQSPGSPEPGPTQREEAQGFPDITAHLLRLEFESRAPTFDPQASTTWQAIQFFPQNFETAQKPNAHIQPPMAGLSSPPLAGLRLPPLAGRVSDSRAGSPQGGKGGRPWMELPRRVLREIHRLPAARRASRGVPDPCGGFRWTPEDPPAGTTTED